MKHATILERMNSSLKMMAIGWKPHLSAIVLTFVLASLSTAPIFIAMIALPKNAVMLALSVITFLVLLSFVIIFWGGFMLETNKSIADGKTKSITELAKITKEKFWAYFRVICRAVWYSTWPSLLGMMILIGGIFPVIVDYASEVEQAFEAEEISAEFFETVSQSKNLGILGVAFLIAFLLFGYSFYRGVIGKFVSLETTENSVKDGGLAIKNAKAIIRGRWWRTFGNLFLIGFIVLAINTVLLMPFGGLMNTDQEWIIDIVGIIPSSILGIFAYCYIFLLRRQYVSEK